MHNLWPMILDVEDLVQYFPTYKLNQIPDREYMFSILATLRNEETSIMIQHSRKNRSVIASGDDKEFVHISAEL